MDIKLFEKYLQICRKHGVEELKIGEIHVKLVSDAPKSRYKQKHSTIDRVEVTNGYTEQDALFWSTGGIPHDEVTSGS